MNRVEYLDYALGGELYHYGVKGMKWGVRKDRSGPSKPKVLNTHSLTDGHGITYAEAKASKPYAYKLLPNASPAVRKIVEKKNAKRQKIHDKAFDNVDKWNKRADKVNRLMEARNIKIAKYGNIENAYKHRTFRKTMHKLSDKLDLTLGAASKSEYINKKIVRALWGGESPYDALTRYGDTASGGRNLYTDKQVARAKKNQKDNEMLVLRDDKD